MAKCRVMDEAGWAAWVATRPAVIQELCARLPPDRLYMLKSSGLRVTLGSYAEDGTVTVDATGLYNALMFERKIFGVKPEDLEECDFPGDDEPLGVMLTGRAEFRNQ